jgi:hypothetical protein
MKQLLYLVVGVILGWFLCSFFQKPEIVTVVQDKIITKTINRNIKDMTCQEAKTDLLCFYSGIPELEIKHLKDDEYLQTAALCERSWQRKTKIKSISKQYKNIIICGIFVDFSQKYGLNAQYYHFWNNIGIGGGVSMSSGNFSLNGGVAWAW